ncbi:MAG: hypothetical protein V5788_01375 [Shewanella sp.]
MAIPKFVNLSSDANTALILNLAGTIKSANSLVYSKSVIAGNQEKEKEQENSPYVLNSTGEPIYINKGYVVAEWTDALENLLDIDAVHVREEDSSKWSYRATLNLETLSGEIAFYLPGEVEAGSNCNVVYYNNKEEDSETTGYMYLEVDTEDC